MPQHRIYLGPHDEVEVPALDGAYVRRGEPVEVDDEMAAQLDLQPDVWAKPNTNAAKNVEPLPEPSRLEPEDLVTLDGQPIEGLEPEDLVTLDGQPIEPDTSHVDETDTDQGDDK
jgi:hypothetical protein